MSTVFLYIFAVNSEMSPCAMLNLRNVVSLVLILVWLHFMSHVHFKKWSSRPGDFKGQAIVYKITFPIKFTRWVWSEIWTCNCDFVIISIPGFIYKNDHENFLSGNILENVDCYMVAFPGVPLMVDQPKAASLSKCASPNSGVIWSWLHDGVGTVDRSLPPPRPPPTSPPPRPIPLGTGH